MKDVKPGVMFSVMESDLDILIKSINDKEVEIVRYKNGLYFDEKSMCRRNFYVNISCLEFIEWMKERNNNGNNNGI